ncbi:hypothetical protein EMN47_14200 [Prolixibacteraceae bacterium JC049]|nr:hypothetical protein [Prolixibacteraceae bacterium JC049]
MNNIDQPVVKKSVIIRNLLISVVVGAVVLLVAVLPAEYNIDPLGAGKALGFSQLYVKEQPQQPVEETQPVAEPVKHKKIKITDVGSPAEVARPKAASLPVAKDQLPERADELTVVVPANKGIEYKFWAKQLGFLKYEWSTNKGELFLDFHGEPKNAGKFWESYAVCYSNNMGGSFLVPFTGKHGWYFRNNSNEDITVTIKLKGQYQLMKK